MPDSSLKFTKQPLMRKVLISLAPITAASVWLFGWRALALIAVTSAAGLLTEWLFRRKAQKPVSEAVFVSSVLFALTLPPSTPFWVAALGITFGILFAKEVFGGFGRNVFNPALVARAFVYVCFPTFLTIRWSTPFSGIPGGLGSWLAPSADAVTTATPLLAFRSQQILAPLQDLFLGRVPGSLGETSALLILVAAVYLVFTKTASWEIMAATLLGFLTLDGALFLMGFPQAPPPLWALCSGGVLFGAVFMATDPITSPKSREGKWIYGLLIGGLTVVIRSFALFTEGMMFAVLIANTFVPILEEGIKAWKASRPLAVPEGGKPRG